MFDLDVIDNEQILQSESEFQLRKLPLVHRSFVREIAFDPTGSFLASVSCDQKCYIWNLNDDCEEMQLSLKSRPAGFKWHHTDHRKFMIFLSDGSIHLYNLEECSPIIYLSALKTDLIRGDWSTVDDSYVAATVLKNYCLIWSVTESALPVEPILSVPEAEVDWVSWSKCNKNVFAVTLAKQNTLCVFNVSDLTKKTTVKFDMRINWINWLPGRNTCAVLSASKLFFLDFFLV